MKKLFIGISLVASGVLSASAQDDSPAKLQVYQNDMDKIYTVFFADVISRTVSISIENGQGTALIQETITGKGFSKPFGLSSLPLGKYIFKIDVDKERYKFPIILKSREEVISESVTIKTNYPTLTVHVTDDNLLPTNIMVFNMKDELLKLFHWKPTTDVMEKEIDLSQFEGYEVRVQVEQAKLIALEQLVPLY